MVAGNDTDTDDDHDENPQEILSSIKFCKYNSGIITSSLLCHTS